MPKRLKKALPRDSNQRAYEIVRRSTHQDEEDPATAPAQPAGLSEYMRAIGSKGGKVSGAKRMTNLTAAERGAIALKAAQARWAKAKKTAKKR
jgi:hypothetical protein